MILLLTLFLFPFQTADSNFNTLLDRAAPQWAFAVVGPCVDTNGFPLPPLLLHVVSRDGHQRPATRISHLLEASKNLQKVGLKFGQGSITQDWVLHKLIRNWDYFRMEGKTASAMLYFFSTIYIVFTPGS